MLTNILALDMGEARIGVALANSIARIAAPLGTQPNDDSFLAWLRTTIAEHEVTQLVVGWPRDINGRATTQTAKVEAFAEKLGEELQLPVHLQDEAVTSVRAETELKSRGKAYQKGDIDSLSAVYILEDFLAEGVH